MKQLFNKLSLRGKLTFIITVTSCLVLLLTFAAVFVLQRASLRSDLLEGAQVLARGISENCAVAIIFNDQQAATLALEPLAAKPHIIGARLFNTKQEGFADFHQNLARDPNIDELETSIILYQGYRFSADHLDVFEPVIHKGEVLGQLMLRSDLAKVNDVLISYAWIGLVIFFIYSTLAFLLANGLQRLISEPIKSLVQSMQTVSENKDYAYRVEKQSHDELGYLFDGFNRMLEELEKRDQELCKNESRLDYLAYHDPLTKLANRLLFQDRLEHSMARAKRLKSRIAILFIDLDRFKHINDSLGHDAGDRVLCFVAERLQEKVREADTLARLGGDEFVIILEHLKKTDDLARFVQKMLKDLMQPIIIAGQKLHVTASLGISIYPENGENVDSLMSAADIAMYQAKHNGSNTYRFYSAEMNTHSRKSLDLENKLREALSHDQLILYYQPQFELKTGLLIGFEALIRWNSPELGFVSPADFIPLAEESGVIVSIGEWVLMTACQTLKELQDNWQIPLRMAVNISPRQFQHDSLVQTVAEALYRSRIEPGCLELEVTEGMVMNNVKHAIAKMEELNAMGLQLAIDVFGTGYSSLGYLKKFPISRLKIDQSFVKDLADNSSDQAIVNSVIALGKNMNLEIIAEGIETVEQFDYLKKAGCDQGQGYLMGKPLNPTKLAELLDSVILNHPEILSKLMQRPKAS